MDNQENVEKIKYRQVTLRLPMDIAIKMDILSEQRKVKKNDLMISAIDRFLRARESEMNKIDILEQEVENLKSMILKKTEHVYQV